MAVTAFLEKHPHVGIMASMTGFAGSFITFLQSASVLIGFIGACFGLLAGFYTWRVKKRHWDMLDREDRLRKEREDRDNRILAEEQDRHTRQVNDREDRKERNE